jgi:uncharacterized protein YlxW (UPF0749 family)
MTRDRIQREKAVMKGKLRLRDAAKLKKKKEEEKDQQSKLADEVNSLHNTIKAIEFDISTGKYNVINLTSRLEAVKKILVEKRKELDLLNKSDGKM